MKERHGIFRGAVLALVAVLYLGLPQCPSQIDSAEPDAGRATLPTNQPNPPARPKPALSSFVELSLAVQVPLLHRQGRYAEAIPLAQRWVELAKIRLGEEHRDYAVPLGSLASLYVEHGDYERAAPVYRKLLELKRKVYGEQDPRLAVVLVNMAYMHYRAGYYLQAEPLCRQAMELQKKVPGEQHQEYASSVTLLALVYEARGDYVRAEPLLRQASEIRRKVPGERDIAYAYSLMNLGIVYKAQGDYARAKPLYQQALAIARKNRGGRDYECAVITLNLAGLYASQGAHAQAEPLFREAVEIIKQSRGEGHPDYAASLLCLGILYHQTNDDARAEPLLRQALELQKKALGEQHPLYASSLMSLASLSESKGDYAKAEQLCRQASEIYRKVQGEQHDAYAGSLRNIGQLRQAQGDNEGAIALLRQSLQITRKHLELTAAVQSERQQMAMLDQARGRLDAYLSTTDAAHAPAETAYMEVLAWKGSVSARQQAIRRTRTTQAKGLGPEAAQMMDDLTAAARAMSELSRAAPKPGEIATHQQKLAALSARIEDLEQALSRVSRPFRQQLDERKRTPADVQKALPADVVLVDLLEYQHASPPENNGKKSNDERRLVAFVVRPDRPVERVELGPVEPIAAAIVAWRDSYGGPSAGMLDPGQQLRRLVWEKIEPHLGNPKTILISPDGTTAFMPWAALPGKQPGTYLVEQAAVAIVPVPRLLPEMLRAPGARAADKEQAPQGPSLLVLGNVDFDADPGKAPQEELALSAPRGGAAGQQRWPALGGTLAEVEAISGSFQRQFPQGRLESLRETRATKAALLAALTRCRYAHLATHGFFTPPQIKSALAAAPRSAYSGGGELLGRQEVAGFHPGLLSGLVLAGANRPAAEGSDDAILTALEFGGLDLSGVELATLSACETGLGKSAGGEGVLGLQRAFQVAGCRNVVASLWKVDDAATAALMKVFYHKLWQENKPPIEALREAQLAILRHPEQIGELAKTRGPDFEKTVKLVDQGRTTPAAKTSPPRLWAAFVISGPPAGRVEPRQSGK